MAENNKFKRGDLVTITAPHLAGVEAEFLWTMVDDRAVCRISGDHHPSGHSHEGSMVIFPTDQLEPRAAVKPAAAALEIEELT